MTFFWHVPVGVVRRYRATYCRQFELGDWITFWVFPYRQVAVGAVSLAGLLAARQLMWIHVLPFWMLVCAIAYWVFASGFENWRPTLPAGVQIDRACWFMGSWRIEFEGVAGRRDAFRPLRGLETHRKVQVVRLLRYPLNAIASAGMDAVPRGPGEATP